MQLRRFALSIGFLAVFAGGALAASDADLTKLTSTIKAAIRNHHDPAYTDSLFGTDGQITAVEEALTGSGADAGDDQGTGVAATETTTALHRTTLTLTNVAIPLVDNPATIAYGSLNIYDWPAGYIHFHFATMDLAITKSSAGVNTDWDGDIGLGTTAADNGATLATTEQNLVPTTATPQAAAGATTGDGQSTATEDLSIIDGHTTFEDVYLNVLVDDADHDVTGTPCNLIFNGTITITWSWLGDN